MSALDKAHATATRHSGNLADLILTTGRIYTSIIIHQRLRRQQRRFCRQSGFASYRHPQYCTESTDNPQPPRPSDVA
ncbi:hypothetical protein CH063_07425 [Colletotrichum higginsianum]|uniref:Uncharacterized protein n=1 Tax=Colletotrichum higginsianum (strain IMI 349063) TaxID=759273 RepID=H1V642_COLHI|nr:hypothetical protein CH063_07425 [Colletotrichum higginsianum]